MKLKNDSQGRFQITQKVDFLSLPVHQEFILKSAEFANRMVLSSSHRIHRSGGSHRRMGDEIFINTFQGKLAEYVIQDTLKSKNIECSEPDDIDYGKRVWDDYDLKVQGHSISVKSMSFFSNLLLLEKKDYTQDGGYKHHRGQDYDFIIVARFKPDIKMVLSNYRGIDKLKDRVIRLSFEFDIPCVCSKKTVEYIIQEGYVLKQGAVLGKNTIMDADNYYIQLGNLPPLEKLISVIDN